MKHIDKGSNWRQLQHKGIGMLLCENKMLCSEKETVSAVKQNPAEKVKPSLTYTRHEIATLNIKLQGAK